MKIYYNSRCRKSRAGLQYLERRGVKPEIVDYLRDQPFSKESLKSLLKKLGAKPQDIIRNQEEIYRKEYKGKKLTDDEWIKVMVDHPKLIRRPIIEEGDKAVLGESLNEIDKVL